MNLFAGIDVGGTRIKYGLINTSYHVIFQDSLSTPHNREDLLELLKKIWKILSKQGKPIQALGLGLPGLFSQDQKKLIQSPHCSYLEGYALSAALAQFIDVSITLDNEANMAAYAEFRLGAGRGINNLVLLTIGSGIGTGIILDGKLWQGACGFAGELGHVMVNPQGDLCKCGHRGCMETEVSATKIIQAYQSLSNSSVPVSAQDIFQMANSGNLDAQEAFAQVARYLGQGMAIAINLLNPEKILLGGGVMAAKDFLLIPATAEAQKFSVAAAWGCCTIQAAGLGNQAGFIGAALQAKNRFDFPPPV